jgi:copper chaperone CopZ
MIRIIRPTLLAIALLMPISAVAAQARYQLQVDGLACPFCAYGIEKELTRTDGVEGIDVDINAGVVIVTMAEGAALTEAEADRIVKDAGFSLNGFTELPADTASTND